jgi:signal transduction histidine kinase
MTRRTLVAPYPPRVDPALELAQAPRRPGRLDVTVTLALLVWAAAEALLYASDVPLGVRLLFVAAWTLPLLAVRRAPAAVLAVLVVTLGAWAVLSDGTNEAMAPFPSLLVTAFCVGLRVRDQVRSAALAVVPVLAMWGVISQGYYADDPAPTGLVILVFFLGGAWGAGRLVLARALQVEREVGAAARTAVADERSRIARELHDVVAHSLSIVSVQASAAQALLTRDPARAAEHLEAVRSSAREGLEEMRRLVGVLREDEPTYAPQPSLDRLGELVADARAAGLPVELDVPEPAPPLPAGLDLAAYRIVQEALTNVRRHAGQVATEVRVRREDDGLALEVVNAPGAPGQDASGAGRGLVGMQERVRMYGGQLHVGPEAGGGWAVRARLPVGHA